MTTSVPTNRKNSFGFLRLLFAVLVILSHSSELLDGNRSRELLTRIFGTLSFGEFGVDGFFLISGYLITSSFIQSKSNFEYLLKRVLRIYPGYVVAYIFSLFVVGTLAGGKISLNVIYIFEQMYHLILLHIPELNGIFAGVPFPSLNGSMFTISYEFRCYLIVMLLGMLGCLKNKKAFLTLTLVLLLALISRKVFALPHQVLEIAGKVGGGVRFFAIFFYGSCFFLFKDRIVYTKRTAIAATAILLPLMFVHGIAEPALVVLGGYVLFWFAFHVKVNTLSRINSRTDLSYGIYLYAWPIQNLVIWHFRNISPWVLFGVTVVTAGVLAYASWTLVERPFLTMKSRFMLTRTSPLVRFRPATTLPSMGD